MLFTGICNEGSNLFRSIKDFIFSRTRHIRHELLGADINCAGTSTDPLEISRRSELGQIGPCLTLFYFAGNNVQVVR